MMESDLILLQLSYTASPKVFPQISSNDNKTHENGDKE